MASKKTAKKRKSSKPQTLQGRLKAVEQKLAQADKKMAQARDKQGVLVTEIQQWSNEIATLMAAKQGILTEINAANQPVQPVNVG
jgi:chromosome segregation ATPase